MCPQPRPTWHRAEGCVTVVLVFVLCIEPFGLMYSEHERVVCNQRIHLPCMILVAHCTSATSKYTWSEEPAKSTCSIFALFQRPCISCGRQQKSSQVSSTPRPAAHSHRPSAAHTRQRLGSSSLRRTHPAVSTMDSRRLLPAAKKPPARPLQHGPVGGPEHTAATVHQLPTHCATGCAVDRAALWNGQCSSKKGGSLGDDGGN